MEAKEKRREGKKEKDRKETGRVGKTRREQTKVQKQNQATLPDQPLIGTAPRPAVQSA